MIIINNEENLGKELAFYLKTTSHLVLCNNLHGACNKDLKTLVTPPEHFCLLMLRKSKDRGESNINPSMLSNHCGISRSAITQTLNSLEKKGFVKRILDDNDRRRFKVEITKKGMDIEREAYKNTKNNLNKIISNLGEEKAKELISLLKQTLEIIK